MLGLCRKAGKLVTGFDATAEAAAKKQLYLMLTAADAAPRTLRQVKFTAEGHNIPFAIIPATIFEISQKTGKNAAVLGIADEGFARNVQDLIRSAIEEETEL